MHVRTHPYLFSVSCVLFPRRAETGGFPGQNPAQRALEVGWSYYSVHRTREKRNRRSKLLSAFPENDYRCQQLYNLPFSIESHRRVQFKLLLRVHFNVWILFKRVWNQLQHCELVCVFFKSTQAPLLKFINKIRSDILSSSE